jgi:hypothetical protein
VTDWFDRETNDLACDSALPEGKPIRQRRPRLNDHRRIAGVSAGDTGMAAVQAILLSSETADDAVVAVADRAPRMLISA